MFNTFTPNLAVFQWHRNSIAAYNTTGDARFLTFCWPPSSVRHSFSTFNGLGGPQAEQFANLKNWCGNPVHGWHDIFCGLQIYVCCNFGTWLVCTSLPSTNARACFIWIFLNSWSGGETCASFLFNYCKCVASLFLKAFGTKLMDN